MILNSNDAPVIWRQCVGHAEDSSIANTAMLKKKAGVLDQLASMLSGDFWRLVSVVVVAITDIKIKTLCVHMEDLVNRGQIVDPPVNVNIRCFF